MTNGEYWKDEIERIDSLGDNLAIIKTLNSALTYHPEACFKDESKCKLCLLDGWCSLGLGREASRLWINGRVL